MIYTLGTWNLSPYGFVVVVLFIPAYFTFITPLKTLVKCWEKTYFVKSVFLLFSSFDIQFNLKWCEIQLRS